MSNRPQIGIEDLHAPSAKKAAAGPPLIAMFAQCSSCHWAIVLGQSIGPPHPDPRFFLAFFLSRPALHCYLGSGGVVV